MRPAAALRQTPPLILLALALVAGDLSAGEGWPLGWAAALAAGAAAAVVLLIGRGNLTGRRLALLLLGFACGYLAAERIYQPSFPPDHIARAPLHRKLQVEATVAADPEIRPSGVRLRLALTRLDDGSGWRPARGAVLVTLRQMHRHWEPEARLRARLSMRRPRNFGNPGEFDYTGYLARRGIYVTAFAPDDEQFQRLDTDRPQRAGWLTRWRRGLASLFEDNLPELQASVMKALILGAAAGLPQELRAAFSRAGVSHVLAISGLHVGLVAAGGYLLWRWLLARSRWLLLTTNVPKLAVTLSGVPVILYAAIAGGGVATVRATIMVYVFLAAVLIDRQRDLFVSLAAAAIAIVLWAPGTTRDVSFQLSFVAVIGIFFGMRRFWPWWTQREETRLTRLRRAPTRLRRMVAVYFAVTVSAVLATAPLTALHFNQVSAMALLANAVVVPLLGSAAVTLGLLAALAWVVAPPVAQICAVVAGPVVQLGLTIVGVLAALPGAAVRLVTPTTFEIGLAYAALLAAVCWTGRVRRATLAAIAALAIADAAWWVADRYWRTDLRVTFLSVGHGDSAVVELPGSEVMVIDGGGLVSPTFDVGERIVAPFLWSRKIGRVDYLVLSHPHFDHYGGLAFVAEQFAPREFWWNGEVAASSRFADLHRQLDRRGVRSSVLRRGGERRLGRVEVRVHSPPGVLDGLNPNDQSVVMTLELGRARVLFAGDIEVRMERELLEAVREELKSSVVKVPHHGSRSSSSASFVSAVSPTLAVASVGFGNRFGFPHPEVVDRYSAQGARVFDTGTSGAVRVHIRADGSIEVKTHHRLGDGSVSGRTEDA